MNLTNLKINDLIKPDAKLTFLVGAGCSVDAPSCLPAGRKMIEAIVKYTCVESELDKILNLEEIRFEQLVEIIQERLDNDLKIIDYYGQCDKPNLQHFFLADMIKKGHYIMTTNFDFLIEYALLQSSTKKKRIVPVITQKDFEKFYRPQDLIKKGKLPVYKIHGSAKNIITKKSTKDSLVATIKAFGLNKEGVDIFSIEPFKRPLFENITYNRSLVVMGYSGSDDFDVVPTLKKLKNIKNIFWINFTKDIKINEEKIYEVEVDKAQSSEENKDNSNKISRILLEIKQINNDVNVYRVDINTSSMVEDLLEHRSLLSNVNFSLNEGDWLRNNVKDPDILEKYFISHKLFIDFDIYDDAYSCLEKLISLPEAAINLSKKAEALYNMVIIFHAQGKFEEALKRVKAAINIYDQIGELKEKATAMKLKATIQSLLGNVLESKKTHQEGYRIAKQIKDEELKTDFYVSEAGYYLDDGNYEEALKRYKAGLKLEEKSGNIQEKATALYNIGLVYENQKKYDEALEFYTDSLKIDEQLGNYRALAWRLGGLGRIYKIKGNLDDALKTFQRAFEISEQIGDLVGNRSFLDQIIDIALEQGNYPEVLKRYEEALQINEQLGDLSGKVHSLQLIGMIYDAQENYPEALKQYEEALQINEQLGDLSGKAHSLQLIGMIYDAQENYPEALKWYEETLEILTRIGLGDSPNANALKDEIKYIKSKLS